MALPGFNYGAGQQYALPPIKPVAVRAPPQRAGHGTCVWPDGSDYDGEWRGGKRNGHGVFKDATTRESGARERESRRRGRR